MDGDEPDNEQGAIDVDGRSGGQLLCEGVEGVVHRSELPVVGQPDERFQGDDPDQGGVDQVLRHLAGREVVPQRPP